MRAKHALVFCMAGLAGPATAAIPASEREALIAIYNSTNGPGWLNKTGWLGAPGTECQWYGVSCILDSVYSLDMRGNNLVGPLPSISALRNLDFIFLTNNQISGPIPSLDGLTRLTHLQMENNRLGGPLPALSGNRQLQQVRLSNNQITGPIPSLAGLDDLTFFLVDNNLLSGPAPNLAGLVDLQVLYLNDNQLSGRMPSLAGLSSLDDLNLSDNRFSGPVGSFAGTPNLSYVRLDGNRFTGVLPPAPPNLSAFISDACPNFLAATPNPAWDAATGDTPWYRDCNTDVILVDGFDP